MEFPKRKTMRLRGHNYNAPGSYFVTVCVKNKECLLSEIVGTGVLDGPQSVLSPYGQIADKHIRAMADFYEQIVVENYVIMPNHIHFLLRVIEHQSVNYDRNGPSRTPVPTQQNSAIARFVSTFKRFCNKEYGKNIWQYRSHDHVVRNAEDRARIRNYIENNPLHWKKDCFFPQYPS